MMETKLEVYIGPQVSNNIKTCTERNVSLLYQTKSVTFQHETRTENIKNVNTNANVYADSNASDL